MSNGIKTCSRISVLCHHHVPLIQCPLKQYLDLKQFSSDASDAESLIESNLDKSAYRKKGETPTQALLTCRREALSLYREILRISALFDWPNEQGVLWRDVLRASARQEFEDARYESDPEVITRLLVVGRDSLHQVAEKFLQKRGETLDPGNTGGNME